MAQIIEIEGELVTIKEVTVGRQVALADLLPHLENRVPVEVPTLPRTAVFVRYDESNYPDKYAHFLCEIAPGIKNIIKNNRRYRLAMPWTYFWFTATSHGASSDWSLNDYRCFQARNPYQDMKSPMIQAFLPNLSSDGTICFGMTGVSVHMTLGDRIDATVNQFLVTRFNSDLDGNFRYPNGWDSFKPWVEASRENPNCWMNWPNWSQDPSFTVEDMIGAGNTPRPTTAMVNGVIPEIQVPFTFGRAEEWLRTINPDMRGRLRVALDNLVEDDPDNVPAVNPLDLNPITDDGGEPVAY